MKRERGVHILFGLSLLTLVVLCAWWLVFFMRSVELERTAQVEERPRPGPLPGELPLEVVPASERRPGDMFAPAVPRHPDLGVRPTQAAVKVIDDKLFRRRLMFIGEGALLFVLLGVCTFMLYRLVRQERRHLGRMESFLSTVTHEMKTPLTGLKSMLQTFAAGRVPEEQKPRLFALGLRETERLEHMVENVLVSGRLRTERYQIQAEPVHLRPLLEGFFEHRRRYQVDRPDAFELIWEPDERDLRAMCDPNALHIVLENLTDNALKYGGEPPMVVVRVQQSEGRVLVAVEDQGIGFAPEKADSLFVPFRRAMEGKETVQHGTGLGLSIARTLVGRMGGELTAYSEGPGRGSRFTIALSEAAP